jgi:Kef-type K+ transport system membrane component KefB
MNEMSLLLGLLVFSYLGNALVAPGQPGPVGLPSGGQFVVLGFVVGPHVLGLVASGAAASFMPLAIVATSWLAFVIGSDCGLSGQQRLPLRAFVLGIASGLVSAAVVGAAVYAAARFIAGASPRDCTLLALGIGLAGAETSRQGVRWALDRGAQPGRLLQLLEELAATDEIVPLLGVAGFFALSPPPANVVWISEVPWGVLTILLGTVLGLTAAWLLASMSAAEEFWSVLLGAALLGTGISWRLGLSPLTTLFVMGVCLSLTSRHAPELRAQLSRTAPGVLVPALLLSGALLRVPLEAAPLWIVVIAVIVRTGSRWLTGYALAGVAGAPRERRRPFGLSLCGTGTVSVLVGLSFALRFPGPVGELVLSASVVSGVLGDVIATFGLRLAFASPAAPDPLALGAS